MKNNDDYSDYYIEGYKCFHDGFPEYKNPYKDEAYYEWWKGWTDASTYQKEKKVKVSNFEKVKNILKRWIR